MNDSTKPSTEPRSDPSSEPASEQPEELKKPSNLQIAFSVMAAAFGVQTDKNRQRDFSQSSPVPYIVGGLIFTVLFVLTIVGVVALVLPG